LGGPSPGQKVDLGMLPPGVEVGGQKATDAISKTLAAISPGQMQDVMAGMKVSSR
jgi:cleavage stimulation factor subunit 2